MHLILLLLRKEESEISLNIKRTQISATGVKHVQKFFIFHFVRNWRKPVKFIKYNLAVYLLLCMYYYALMYLAFSKYTSFELAEGGSNISMNIK